MKLSERSWGTSSDGPGRGDEAEHGEEGQGVAAHDGGGGVGEPEESDGGGDAEDGDGAPEDGRRVALRRGDRRDGGEELGVGGALVCGEEGVGVDEVEDGGEGARRWGAAKGRARRWRARPAAVGTSQI